MVVQPAGFEANTVLDLEHVVNGVKKITSQNAFTVVCFASHAQMGPFHEKMSEMCNLGATLRFVHFRDKPPSVNHNHSFNSVECVVVGHIGPQGKPMPPWMNDWSEGALYQPTNDATNARDCFMVSETLRQHYRMNGQVTPPQNTLKFES